MAAFLCSYTYVTAGSQRKMRVWGSKVKGLVQEYRQSCRILSPAKKNNSSQLLPRGSADFLRDKNLHFGWFCVRGEGGSLEWVEVGGAWRE